MKVTDLDASRIKSGLIDAERIKGVKIEGSLIEGATLKGTVIKIGEHGYLRPAGDGLRVCAPAFANAKHGVGMQVLGNTGRLEDAPYGVYIYKDPNFESRATEYSKGYLLTVNGYIKTLGVNNLVVKNHGDKGVTIGNYYDQIEGESSFGLYFGKSPTKGTRDVWYSWKGDIYSLWYQFKNDESDIKLKKNIESSKTKVIELIEKLDFKKYDWKDKIDQKRKGSVNVGLIAQDVQKLDKNLVYENGDNLHIDSFKMLNIALKAIQELNTKITILEEKLND